MSVLLPPPAPLPNRVRHKLLTCIRVLEASLDNERIRGFDDVIAIKADRVRYAHQVFDLVGPDFDSEDAAALIEAIESDPAADDAVTRVLTDVLHRALQG